MTKTMMAKAATTDASPARKLSDLAGIGPAMMEDFRLLGVTSVAQLARCDDKELYTRLCEIRGQRIDPCCLDVFTCAIEQARDPELEPAKRNWWYWSRVRKQQNK